MKAPLVAVQRLRDGEVLRSLRLEALADAPAAFLGHWAEEAGRRNEEWQQAVVRGVWFAALVEQVPVGLVSVVLDAGTQERYVESMWVRAQWRGRGVVDALLAAVEAYVVGCGGAVLRLWVLAGNDTAARAYQRYGFRPTGLRQPVPAQAGVIEEEYAIAVPSRPRAVAEDSSADGGGQNGHLMPKFNALTSGQSP